MFDIGWSELLIIGLVALIVVGPKDLPVMFRNIGRWVGRLRNMARDFQRAMDDAADQAGVKDIKKGLSEATNMQDKIFGDAASSLKNFQDEVDGKPEIKKIDAAAEHAKRQKMVEEANKAAENWTQPEEGAEGQAKTDLKPVEKKAPSKANTKTRAKSATKPKVATPKATEPKKTANKATTTKSTKNVAPSKKVEK
ncbi:MAG: Sec-independent protein translocase protein TatB [Pseudomonadota bacterium]